MAENVFFLDAEHVEMGGILSPQNVVCLFILCVVFKNYFTRL